MAKQNQQTGRPGPNRGETFPTEGAAPGTFDVIDFCRRLNVTAELVGSWVWVSFAETPDEETRKALKEFGFRWSARRRKWAHNCGVPTKSARQTDPWAKYGAKIVNKAKEAIR